MEPLQGLSRLESLVVDARSVQAAAFLEWIFLDRAEELLSLVLNGLKQPDVLRVPLDIRFAGSSLVRIGPEIDDGRPTGRIACAGGDVTVDHGKMDFPVIPANSIQLTTLAEVDSRGPFFSSPLK